MIVVMSCAASKKKCAGTLTTRDGKLVKFVAHPKQVQAPNNNELLYAHPDDKSDHESGLSWRGLLDRCNDNPVHNLHNPLCLWPAWQLYENKIYRKLVCNFTTKNVYILSAGWGLVRSDYLVPNYDITFSTSNKVNKAFRRNFQKDHFEDHCQLPSVVEGPIVFFGGKDYFPLLHSLMEKQGCKKIVFYSASRKSAPDAPGYCLMKSEYGGTNWHYRAACKFIEDEAYRLSVIAC